MTAGKARRFRVSSAGDLDELALRGDADCHPTQTRGLAHDATGSLAAVAPIAYPRPVPTLKPRGIRALRACLLPCLLLLCLAGCNSSGNPKVPAGAKSSGGMHAVIDTDKGPIEHRVLRDGRAEGGRELPPPRRTRLLRRPHLPSHRPGLHDPGRRSEGRRHGRRERVGCSVRGRDHRQGSPLYAAATGAGSWPWPIGAEHQRQPVLHPARELPAATQVRDLRARDRPGSTSWTHSPTCRRRWARMAARASRRHRQSSRRSRSSRSGAAIRAHTSHGGARRPREEPRVRRLRTADMRTHSRNHHA